MKECLPVEPFRAWLNTVVQENSIVGVASCIGVAPRRISSFLTGSYMKHKKPYPIQSVSIYTVDRWMTAFRQHYKEIYPDA